MEDECAAGNQTPNKRSALYFGTGYATSVWNNSILEILVQELKTRRAEDKDRLFVPDVSDIYLKSLFHGHLTQARSEWSRHQIRAHETEEEARERVEQQDAKRANSTKQTARKKAVSV